MNKERRENRFFFWLVVLTMVITYGMAVGLAPALQTAAMRSLFTILMLIHLALHWLRFQLLDDRRGLLLYVIVQAGLAFIMVYLSQLDTLVPGLFMPLIGQVFGLVPTWRKRWGYFAGLLGVASLNVMLISGWEALLVWVVFTIPISAFVIIYVVLFTRQVEARKQAQRLLAELEIANHQLAEYALQVEDLTLTNERQRMARELHDTLAQGLAGLVLQLEAAASHLEHGRNERAAGIVQQAMSRARATLADARRAIDDLRQEPDPNQGLGEAVRSEALRFERATGIPCAAQVECNPELTIQAKEHLLRILAEGLTNIARHAQARQVNIRLACEGGQLALSLQDDGCGFDPAALSRNIGFSDGGHYGLLGMRERARLLGGHFELSSQPGNGTHLRLTVPLEKGSSPAVLQE